MLNCPLNKIVNILLIETTDMRHMSMLNNAHDRRHPADRLICRNPFHRQIQRNRLQNNNDFRVFTILKLIHINPHITRQAKCQFGVPRATIHQILQSIRYRPYHITLV